MVPAAVDGVAANVAQVSFIQPMFHFIEKPSRRGRSGATPAGRAVGFSAMVSAQPGNSAYHGIEFLEEIDGFEILAPPCWLGSHSPAWRE